MDIYIMNIQAEQKRRYICEGALFAMGTPFVHVKRWIAIDDLNYIKTRELLEDAIADGFPGFQSHLDRGLQNRMASVSFARCGTIVDSGDMSFRKIEL